MTKFGSVVRLSPAVAPFLLACLLSAQTPTPSPALQQKLEALQQASAQNEQKLHTYQWLETTTVTVKGSPKPPKQSLCRYTSYGTVAKTPIGPQQQAPQPSGGPFKRRIMEKKIEEVQEEGAEARDLTALYLPMKPAALKHALETRRVDFEHGGPSGNAIIIHDYVKPGDQLALELDAATMKLRRITVKSYFSSPQDVLTASVDFSSLEDGTTYPSITTINAPSKGLAITTVSSNFTTAIQ
jgi:hypothetical protein